jgi:hypothetical protein
VNISYKSITGKGSKDKGKGAKGVKTRGNNMNKKGLDHRFGHLGLIFLDDSQKCF